MPTSTHSLRPDSKGSSMPSPTLTPPASLAPLLAASIAPGPPPVITAKPASTSARPSCSAEGVRRVVGRRAGRAEHGDRRAELGQRAEALDELGLDPQHPPRVGVHPVGGPARVEQPLVGGAAVDLVAALDRPGPSDFGSACPSHASATSAAAGRSQRSMCSTGTCSSCLWASIGSPGPKLTAGMPRRGEAGHVGPAELGVDLADRPPRRTPWPRAGRARAARRARCR